MPSSIGIVQLAATATVVALDPREPQLTGRYYASRDSVEPWSAGRSGGTKSATSSSAVTVLSVRPDGRQIWQRNDGRFYDAMPATRSDESSLGAANGREITSRYQIGYARGYIAIIQVAMTMT